jgi:hypothetical protein
MSIVLIGHIDTFVGFIGETGTIRANNPSESITAVILANDITDLANTPTAMDDIDLDIAAAFNSLVDVDFITKIVVGGSHNDKSIFPALDYESDVRAST